MCHTCYDTGFRFSRGLIRRTPIAVQAKGTEHFFLKRRIGERERKRERERQTDRQTDRQRDREEGGSHTQHIKVMMKSSAILAWLRTVHLFFQLKYSRMLCLSNAPSSSSSSSSLGENAPLFPLQPERLNINLICVFLCLA